MSQTALDEELVYMFHSQRQTCTRDRNIVTRAPLCTLRGKKVFFFFFMPGSKIKVQMFVDINTFRCQLHKCSQWDLPFKRLKVEDSEWISTRAAFNVKEEKIKTCTAHKIRNVRL